MTKNTIKTQTFREIKERAANARSELANLPPVDWSESQRFHDKIQAIVKSNETVFGDLKRLKVAGDRLASERQRQAMRRGLAIDAAMVMGVPVNRQALMPCTDVSYITVGGVRWRYGRDRGGIHVAVPDSLA